MAVSAEGVRVERDALGEKQIAASVLYGIHTLRALEKLSFANRPLHTYPDYVAALAYVKWAAAEANQDAGVIEAETAAAIVAAAQQILEGRHREHFVADVLAGGGSIAVHMNVNEVIANLANEHLGGQRGTYDPVHPKRHVGASQSTADVCHTAVRLAAMRVGWPLIRVLDRLGYTLREKAVAFAKVPTLARTCLQDAMPTTLAILFDGYARTIEQRRAAVADGIEALREVALGGTVIGTGEGAPPRYREQVVDNLQRISGIAIYRCSQLPHAMQTSDDIRSISAGLAALAESLIRICRDLRLLASGPNGGFGEILLPHVLEGSSFFGNKRNPVIPETVMQCCFQVLGCERSVQAACENAELYLNVFDALAAINILDAMRMLTAALKHLDEDCLRGLTANEDRCLELSRLAMPTRG